MNIQDWFPLGWTGWICLQSKGPSRVFYNTSWVYLSLSPLLFTSPLSSAIFKASSDNHIVFLHLFCLGMVLVFTSYTVLQTSVHSSSSTLSTRSNSLNRVTNTAWARSSKNICQIKHNCQLLDCAFFFFSISTLVLISALYFLPSLLKVRTLCIVT